MILIDYNQIVISSIMKQMKGSEEQVEDNLIKHLIINNLRFISKQFKKDYGKIVICCDNKNSYWRREYFPYYKHNRKKLRDNSKFDWNFIHESMSTIKKDLIEFFPYSVVEVAGGEADDVIAVLAKAYHGAENVLIASGDEDFYQLQIYPSVKQYSLNKREFVVSNDPQKDLKEHILRGDSSDGIPNFLSQDDIFLVGRQKTLTQKRLKEYMELENPGHFYERNKVLIDFSKIPEKIEKSVLENYRSQTPKNNIRKYLIENRIKNMIEVIEDF